MQEYTWETQSESKIRKQIQEHAGMNKLEKRIGNKQVRDQIREGTDFGNRFRDEQIRRENESERSICVSERSICVSEAEIRKQVQEHAGMNRLQNRFGIRFGEEQIREQIRERTDSERERIRKLDLRVQP